MRAVPFWTNSCLAKGTVFVKQTYQMAAFAIPFEEPPEQAKKQESGCNLNRLATMPGPLRGLVPPIFVSIEDVDPDELKDCCRVPVWRRFGHGHTAERSSILQGVLTSFFSLCYKLKA